LLRIVPDTQAGHKVNIKICLIILFSMLISITSKANVIVGNFDKKKEFKYGIAIEHPLVNGSEDIIINAMKLVTHTLRGKLNLTGTNQEDFDFLIQISDRRSFEAQDKEVEELKKFTTEIKGDAYSIFFSDMPGSPVIVRVLWDEAMTEIKNGKRQERPDAFARLVTLLGHEIYGNVNNFISRRSFFESPQFMYSKEVQKQEYIKSEVYAFTKGVDFLETLLSLAGPRLPEKLNHDFRNALLREKELLTSYQRKLGASTSSPCATTLKFIK
jgi:hypothetical protein